jgi:hypothetical protein
LRSIMAMPPVRLSPARGYAIFAFTLRTPPFAWPSLIEGVEENPSNWDVPIARIITDKLPAHVDQLAGSCIKVDADDRRSSLSCLPQYENVAHPENVLPTCGPFDSVFGHAG